MKLFKTLLSALFIASFCILSCEAKTPWSSKPPLGSQIDWSHPLSRGLVGCWLMNEGGGLRAVDLAKYNNGVITAGAGGWVSTQKGRGYSFDNASTVINCGKKPSVNNLAPMSIVSLIYPKGAGENNIGYIVGKVGGTQAFSWSTTVNAALAFAWTGSTATLNRISANNTMPFNNWYFTVLTWDGVITDITGSHIYINGIEPSYGAGNTNGGGTHDDSGGNLCIGNRDTDTARTWNGYIVFTFIYNRVLSPSEIRQLYQEPYCFIKPQTDWNCIKAAVAAAGRWVQYIMHNSVED